MIDNELRKQIVRLHFEQGRTVKSLSEEFGVSKNAITRWISAYREEAAANAEKEAALKSMEEVARLRRENEKLKKENDFLKKAAAFFAKESR
jgi:transposase